jgi:hypothetical protein
MRDRSHDAPRAVRPAALPPGWYPGSDGACRRQVEAWVEGVAPDAAGGWQGAIVPHAGWVYSGALAAQTLARLPRRPDLVVLFGGHARPEQPAEIVLEAAWDVPGGPVPLHAELAREVMGALGGVPDDAAWADNSMEVLVPLIAVVFTGVPVLALRPPMDPSARDIGARVAACCAARGLRAVAVGSTDLTHYGPNYRFTDHGPAETARPWVVGVNDQRFIDRCLARDAAGAVADARRHHSACSPGAAAAVIGFTDAAAVERAPDPLLVGHTTSYDVTPASSFVGYAGVLA